jgi:CHASE2 domain-containing sensor protein
VITPFSTWPQWLQILVIAPNGLLAGVACWLWWPKSHREWRKFGIVLAYLIIFYSVMYFVFGFR